MVSVVVRDVRDYHSRLNRVGTLNTNDLYVAIIHMVVCVLLHLSLLVSFCNMYSRYIIFNEIDLARKCHFPVSIWCRGDEHCRRSWSVDFIERARLNALSTVCHAFSDEKCR